MTGAVAGLVAKWRQSMALGVAAGLVVGFVLSAIAAQGQPDHFWSIVLPGMLVGVLTGIITQRSRAAGAAVILVLTAAVAAAQTAPAPLSPLDPFLGKWQGTQEGQPGTGTVEREYARILRSRFIQVTNRSVYPPQEKNPKGEEHEDIGTFSHDNARKRIVFRQFHVEGFVVQFAEPGKDFAIYSRARLKRVR